MWSIRRGIDRRGRKAQRGLQIGHGGRAIRRAGHRLRGNGPHRWAGAILPIAGQRLAQRIPLCFHAQHSLFHFRLRPVIATHIRQPALVLGLVIHPIQAAGNAPRQRHSNLRAKAGSQVQGILHRITPAAAQIKRPQIRVHFLKVGHGRHNAILQNLDRNHILYPHAHRVAGETLGIGHHNLVGRLAKSAAQGHHLRRGAAAASRGEGLMGHEDQLRGHGVAVQAKAAFGRCYQVVHHLGNVVHIQPGAVEGTVASLAAEQFHQAAHAPFTYRILALDHQGARAHAHNGAMPAAVERQRRLVYLVAGGDGPHAQEAGAHPF